jgi:signal transduction histidine kinase
LAKAAALFVPFNRLHAGVGYDGFGIGRATVQLLVAWHDGRVWVKSAPGRGATFFFTL